jgi:hypothetical protein
LPELFAEIDLVRHEAREANGGGGMCHEVGDYLMEKFGWPRPYVTVLSDDGRVICAPHVVNILPDGSILDATRDQFGFAETVKIIPPGTPEHGRYRPEFSADWHPGSPEDTNGSLAAWIGCHDGRPDDDAGEQNAIDLGRGWWLEPHDLARLEEYDAKNAAYRRERTQTTFAR